MPGQPRTQPVGYELFGYVRFVPGGEDGEPSDFFAHVDFTRRPPSATPTGSWTSATRSIGAWRGQFGAVAAMTLVWGRPLVSGGRIVTAELADLAVDQCELVDERFTLIAPDDYRHDLLEIKLFDVKGRELARESLYAGEDEDQDDEDDGADGGGEGNGGNGAGHDGGAGEREPA